MKIGILTHPLGVNYGGLLQAFALQTVLKNMGNEPWILSREMDVTISKRLKRFIRRMQKRIQGTYTEVSDKNLVSFKKKITPKTEKITDTKELAKKTAELRLNAIIVGSDQIWRPRYVKPIENYFLDFVSSSKTKCISYAASFGIDYWEFSPEQTERCKNLLKKFNAVSVREKSGILLCNEYLECNAVQVLDPVMLLSKEFYENLIVQTGSIEQNNNIFQYIFDISDESNIVSQGLSKLYKSQIHTLAPQSSGRQVIPESVETWLRNIRSSRLVLTDSFHVCVFCIIFNTPFYVLNNSIRGNTRIESLLELFELSERLIDSHNIPTSIKEIDWTTVNLILKENKMKSLEFLQNSLS